MNVNTINELAALRIELRRYELDGRTDRAEQVRREIAGRVAVVRDALAQLDQQAKVGDAIEDHVKAAEARAAAKQLRQDLAEACPDEVDEGQDAAAAGEPPVPEPEAADAGETEQAGETAADSAPREQAVPPRKTNRK